MRRLHLEPHPMLDCRSDEIYPRLDLMLVVFYLLLFERTLGAFWALAFQGLAPRWTYKEILGIPQDIRVVDLLVLGYPAKPSQSHKDRLPLKEIVMHERWSKK